MGNDYQYHGGRVTSKHSLDPDRFGYLDLEEEVEKLGYISWDSLRFKDPTTETYKVIKDDVEVLELTSQVFKGCKHISVYVDNAKEKTDISGSHNADDCESSDDPVVEEMLAGNFESGVRVIVILTTRRVTMLQFLKVTLVMK